MSNTTGVSIQTPMPHLANSISIWLEKSEQTPSDELNNFMQDLNSGTNLESWAAVNFERILPLRIPRQARAELFDMVRNALVLLPLAITWIGIWHASKGYSTYWPQNPGSNFLVYWEQLEGLGKLSTIAIIDGLILAAIFGMTIYSDRVNRNSESRQELERMHEGMIVSLERGLSSYRFLSLPELNQYASSTVQNISDAYQMVAASTQDLASTAQQSEAVMVRLESIITNQFQPTAMMLDQVVQGLSSAVGTHNQLVTVVQNAQNGLAATQQQMGAYVQQMQSSFSAELSALRSGVDDMVRNAGSGSQQIVKSFGDSLDRTIQSLSNSLAQTVNDLARSSSDAANAINNAASSMADTSDVLKSTMASVELGVQRMNADLDSIHRKI